MDVVAPHRTAAPLASWPRSVRHELEARGQAALAAATGRVVELGTVSSDGPYDTVISVGALTAFADLPRAIREVDDLLADEGRFVFIEPVGVPGWRGVAGMSAGASLRALRGLHVGRDVPGAVRAAGFVIIRLERFEISTPVWPLRHFVEATAQRLPPGAAGGAIAAAQQAAADAAAAAASDGGSDAVQQPSGD